MHETIPDNDQDRELSPEGEPDPAARRPRYPFALWQSLTFKMTAATALILSLVMGAGFWYLALSEKRFELDEAENQATRVAELVIQSFDRMASNRRPFHNRYLAQKLLELPQVHNLRVLAPDGTVQFSRYPEEVNRPLDMTNKAPCMDCHTGDRLLSWDRTYRAEDGTALFHLAFEIPNVPSCVRCHRPEFTVLGTLIVETEIDSLFAKIARTRNAIAVTVLASLLISILGTTLLFRRMVKRPLDQLRHEMHKVERGDFAVAPSPAAKDELREVYESFLSMTARLEEVQRHLNERLDDKSAVVDDLTHELRRIYSNLIRMEHLSAVGTLSSQVVHEVRTPLNALSLNLQLLNQELSAHLDLRSEAQDLARNIGCEVDRIALILERFLDRARQPLSPPVETSLHRIVTDVTTLMELEARKAAVTIETGFEGLQHRQPLRGDELRQILINLMSNAIQAMPRGGTLRIDAQSDEQGLTLSVTDTGVGIPPENHEKVFAPFFTTRANGTGLGLVIVQRLASEMGGSISFAPNPGGGTVFRVYLPWPGLEERDANE